MQIKVKDNNHNTTFKEYSISIIPSWYCGSRKKYV